MGSCIYRGPVLAYTSTYRLPIKLVFLNNFSAMGVYCIFIIINKHFKYCFRVNTHLLKFFFEKVKKFFKRSSRNCFQAAKKCLNIMDTFIY